MYKLIIYFCIAIIIGCNSPHTVKIDMSGDANKEILELYNQRDSTNADSLIIGGLYWGMSPYALVDALQKNNISDCFFPENFTASSLRIGEQTFDIHIQYGFDSNNQLVYVDMMIPEFEYDRFYHNLRATFGKKYLRIKYNNSNDCDCVWYRGNCEYLLVCQSFDAKLAHCFRFCISNTKYIGDVKSCAVSFVDFVKEVFVSSNKNFLYISNYCRPSLYENVKYDGTLFEITSYFDTQKQMTEQDARAHFLSNKVYHVKKMSYVYYEPNGRMKIRSLCPKDYYTLYSGTEVAILSIDGEWVKVLSTDVSGWIHRNDIRENFSEVSDVKLLPNGIIYDINNPKPYIYAGDSNRYSSNDDKRNEYYKSVAREKAFKDAGMNEFAKRERKERQNKVRTGEYVMR